MSAVLIHSLLQTLKPRYTRNLLRNLCSQRRKTMGVIEVKVDNGVQTIKFNRPEKKNAINREIYEGLISTLEQSADDDRVVLTVLTGSGDYYSSGNDFSLPQITDMKAFFKDSTDIVGKFVAAFIDYPKLLIAVVNGPALGIAATTLALCDVVYASDKAWFQTPFTQLGLVPEGCSSVTFPHIMGSKASRLLYLNEKMTADEALACGFVTQVFPDAQIEAQTSAKIREHAKLPLQSLMLSKQLVRKWNKQHLHEVNRTECQALAQRFVSEDFFNALLSFKERKSKL
ncbi:enoyl-CoA delta isomerase 2-like isoform X1 [Homalodisca vitripennis]|uniref:enoyl-CoA delta isomerase 2-like isoform X1 n=2 Tax=Homalodisca vitripennis TaxID=197043 RepID=UPI001EEA6314|nr:enoyl-CoA delta isomerase 2-like isoform X1 [Homalodisca vitripennis]